jgi:hypothetical protein
MTVNKCGTDIPTAMMQHPYSLWQQPYQGNKALAHVIMLQVELHTARVIVVL